MAPLNKEKLAKKASYLNKLKKLFNTIPNVLLVTADHVGSHQMQEIRLQLRGKAEVVMGKNTMIRTAMKQYEQLNPDSEIARLMNYVKGNIGFIFCHSTELDLVRKVVSSNRVPAAAKAGVLAPCDVCIPAGPSGLDPSQTNFFQALNIATKIVKGQIEISSDVMLLKEGQKVQASEQVLLQKLNIRPFSYGLKISHVYDGSNIYDVSVLDIKDDSILRKFNMAVRNVASLSREVGIPTQASVVHSVGTAFKRSVALVSAMEDVSFTQAAKIKEFLKDPSKFMSSAPIVSDSSPKAGDKKGSKKVAEVAAPVVEEEEEADAGFSLFD